MRLIDEALNCMPSFADETIGGYRPQLNSIGDIKSFAVEEKWDDCATVEIFKVRGTAHPDYCGISWRELLSAGKRMPQNLALLDSNPEYYVSRDKKHPSMNFEMVDGSLYLAGDGNHRTCIARFYLNLICESFLHGVELREFVTDKVARANFNKVKELLDSKGLFHVEALPLKEKVSREDSPGRHVEKFKVDVLLKNRMNGMEHTLSTYGCDPLIGILEKWSFLNRHGIGLPEILRKD